MDALSDLLGFRHHTCARGRTVDRAFLVDLVLALGKAIPRGSDKYALLGIAYETFYGTSMPADLRSTGGTITDLALDAILAGARDAEPSERVAPRVVAQVAASEHQPDKFDLLMLADDRRYAWMRGVARPEQRQFRDSVIAAYDGTCAITGVDHLDALEAAHITPYRGRRSNHIQNGVLLRADLHRLWDRGHLAVHEESLTVLLTPDVGRSWYGRLAGRQIRVPSAPTSRPHVDALRAQRAFCGL